MTSIAIIGTAGRGPLSVRLSWSLYQRCVGLVESTLSGRDLTQITLVSGGAAWMDHVAVTVFLRNYEKGLGLRLFLPVPLVEPSDMKERVEFRCTREGLIMNHYHDKFQVHLPQQVNPRAAFNSALQHGAEIKVIRGGFKKRNFSVGKVDEVWAFTWAEGEVPAEGGTRHTWDHSSAPVKRHASLLKLLRCAALQVEVQPWQV